MPIGVKKSLPVIIFTLVAIAAGVFFLIGQQGTNQAIKHVEAIPEKQDREVNLDIVSGTTFAKLLTDAGVEYQTIMDIIDSAKDTYDLTTVRPGQKLTLYYRKDNDQFYKLQYRIGTENDIFVTLNDDGTWQAVKQPIPYELKVQEASGTITEALYLTALEQGMDERLVLQLADMFAWQVDFTVDVRKGDQFKVIYEARYLDGQYVMPGNILAASYTNDGTKFEGYYFQADEEHSGHYDAEGNSLAKIFLKAPLQYRYISSGFTGARVDPISRAITTHYATDYAAPSGTPVVTVGDGTVIRAGWNGGYGNSVDVRHNDQYTTRYGHFSRLNVKVGQKVKQGDIIGYVGSTGWSTGPHLHYEMMKYGTKINPFKEVFPSNIGISADHLEAFKKVVEQYQNRI